ncbi:FKBP-type peptidyl-prolyl cis-trans isomerase [Methanolobus psychrotolerans]|uniref:FKBP-type peptidyl-prolyl cis-trans isomerase n=1 Tax=Methanolobus psychrotolerans TaxID=1874706 RepID=UPI000B916067|nr:peptidylprolyl isomerase [Methanolobus psychrotolerans]
MAIEKGDFIKINYTGRFNEGQIFDTTDEQLAKDNGIFNPRGVYGGDIVIVGSGHTIRGLDEDFVGKEVGYSGSIALPPEKAFGPHNPALVETVSITKLTEQFKDQRPYQGMPVEINGRRGVIAQIIGRRVRVDLNHALAGKEVEYEYTIVDKIEDKVAKAQGLLSLYTGMPEIEVEVTDDLIRVHTPIELGFNQRWLVSKMTIASELISKLDIPKLEYVETHPYVPPTAEVEAAEVPEASAENEEAEATEE